MLAATAAHALPAPSTRLTIQLLDDNGFSPSDGLTTGDFGPTRMNPGFRIVAPEGENLTSNPDQVPNNNTEHLYILYRALTSDEDDCMGSLPSVFNAAARSSPPEDWTAWGNIGYLRSGLTTTNFRNIHRTESAISVTGDYCFLVTYARGNSGNRTSVPGTYGTLKVSIDADRPDPPTIAYGAGTISGSNNPYPKFLVTLSTTNARTGLFTNNGCTAPISELVLRPAATAVTLTVNTRLRGGGHGFYASEEDEAGNMACSRRIGYQRNVSLVDYDRDDDGLIEISTLEQLDAMRYDIDGNGCDGRSREIAHDVYVDCATYEAAFPDPINNMGCLSGCVGYELDRDLDFAGSKWSRTGSVAGGWQPLTYPFNQSSNRGYTGILRGNGHTISNLYINRSDRMSVGLFERLGQGAQIEGVGLLDVDITGSNRSEGIGSLVGLVRRNTARSPNTRVTITACYATGALETPGQRSFGNGVGGIVGGLSDVPVTINASYAIVSLSLVRPQVINDENRFYNTPNIGGIVGVIGNSLVVLSINASYAVGVMNVEGRSRLGGIVGANTPGQRNPNLEMVTIANSYWDAEATGIQRGIGRLSTEPDLDIPRSAGMTGRELRAPTTYTGIYSDWNLNLDGVAGNDNPWDFGTRNQYPTLRWGSSSNTMVDTAAQFMSQTPASGENRLANLTVAPGILVPAFSSATENYTVAVVDENSVTVTAAAADGRYPPVIRSAAGSAASSYQVSPLVAGESTRVTVTVEAEDYTTREYVVTVTRRQVTRPELSELRVLASGIDPIFNVAAGTTEYRTEVPFAVSTVTVAAMARADANVEITPADADDDTVGHQVGLPPGERGRGSTSIVTVNVSRGAGADLTTQTYTITVVRMAGATDAQLSELRVLGGDLMPPFDAAAPTTQHSVVVPFEVDGVTVEARAREANANVRITPDGGDPGAPAREVSRRVELGPGQSRLIGIEVTAQDGVTMQAYAITATRSRSANANLRNLIVSAPGVDRLRIAEFDADTVEYNAYVSYETTRITVTAVPAMFPRR